MGGGGGSPLSRRIKPRVRGPTVFAAQTFYILSLLSRYN
uniref:Uncharacterized protein n=1 Tax=Jatropha curcas TaxID=180498 RepID=E2CXF2_JATCU|nr:hypothetical protein [Jatropha curcas]